MWVCNSQEYHFQRPRYWVEFLKTTVHTEVKLYRVHSDSPLAHYSEGNKTFRGIIATLEIVILDLLVHWARTVHTQAMSRQS